MKIHFGRVTFYNEQSYMVTDGVDSWELVLGKGYLEHVFARPPVEGYELPPIIVLKRRRFQIIHRKVEHACRFEMRIDRRRNKIPCAFIELRRAQHRPAGYWITLNGRIGSTKHTGSDGKIITFGTIGKVAIWQRSN